MLVGRRVRVGEAVLALAPGGQGSDGDQVWGDVEDARDGRTGRAPVRQVVLTTYETAA